MPQLQPSNTIIIDIAAEHGDRGCGGRLLHDLRRSGGAGRTRVQRGQPPDLPRLFRGFRRLGGQPAPPMQEFRPALLPSRLLVSGR